MYTTRLFALLAALLAAPSVVASDGLITIVSNHDVETTMDRLEANVKEAGFNVVARVNHAGAASKVDLKLAPTELLIFGNPKAGTKLMQADRRIAIDLPVKYVVWQDDSGKTHIGWNDPAWLVKRHGIKADHPVAGKMTGALRKFASAAAE